MVISEVTVELTQVHCSCGRIVLPLYKFPIDRPLMPTHSHTYTYQPTHPTHAPTHTHTHPTHPHISPCTRSHTHQHIPPIHPCIHPPTHPTHPPTHSPTHTHTHIPHMHPLPHLHTYPPYIHTLNMTTWGDVDQGPPTTTSTQEGFVCVICYNSILDETDCTEIW